ncbi:DEAD/DEAH box helicase family protein [Archangium lipolyticum]|uniref:DEAD/DEAH box helicase family protein n=1 Tax=Archangium lipolyticum TaxID=2970465 RepID=UPI002149C269|nr:DEAD/DEAH box helicase family protein [Archangium lipolyticum]
MSIQLLPFQVRASQQIVNRYFKLTSDPKRPSVHKSWDVPFYQALSALTGAGKTPILADAVAQIRSTMSPQPIVLWISKAKAVVDQTFTNFEPGGKYSHLIPQFTVEYLSDLTPQQISDGNTAFLALTTVGTFNQKDKGDGTLKVHKISQDSGAESLWATLGSRKTGVGQRRPLVIVYDEAQNLADQQVELLLELEPDAILVASATMRVPGRLGKLIDRLKDHGWSDVVQSDPKEGPLPCLVTAVSSKAVVKAELVKRQVVLGGYTSIMETMLDEMHESMKAAAEKARVIQAGFEPKAIYVCRTNINQEDGTPDLPSKPFNERKAPPILIWRYLVEQKKVDPASIAVYCDLKFDRMSHPPPADFKLFSGGEQDFAVFSAGNYKHIIFNQSLQEGWDDPECCFAYIDKSMGSDVQIEQVIGRVLRQPGARYYQDPDLNTASFYIRVDNKQEFPRILKMVKEKLGADLPEVRVEGYSDPKERQRVRHEPKKVLTVPSIHIDASEAVQPLTQAVKNLHDYRKDPENTVGQGEVYKAVQPIGTGTKAEVQTQSTPHSHRVMARWIVRREMLGLYPEVVKAIEWSKGVFDARVEITSKAAAALRSEAEKLVDTYLSNSALVFEEENPYTVGPLLVNPAKAKPFTNALHDTYDLSPLEYSVAEAIDETGLDWARNPSPGGYSIPLLHKGDTHRFFPDFLVWKDGVVFAIDPKGGHLLLKDAGLKLLNIQDENGKKKIRVRLISVGRWNDQVQCLSDNAGYTVWSLTKTTQKLKATPVETVKEAVETALKG